MVRHITEEDFDFRLKTSYEESSNLIKEDTFAEVVSIVQLGIDGFDVNKKPVFGSDIDLDGST